MLVVFFQLSYKWEIWPAIKSGLTHNLSLKMSCVPSQKYGSYQIVCFICMLDVFPSVCDPDLFFPIRFMTIEQRYDIVVFIHIWNVFPVCELYFINM